MARNLREVIATLSAERRAKIAAAHTQKLIAEEQKLIAEKKKWQLEEAKRLMELDHKLIVFAVLIAALPIVAALVWMLTVWVTNSDNQTSRPRGRYESAADH